MNKASLFFILFFLLIFTSCSSQVNLSSINFDACFMSYNEQTELTEALQNLEAELDVENPSTAFMTVVGCINYQLGNYNLSESWLKRAFKESKDEKTKNIAAGALSLIYLKELKKENIKPYIASVRKSPLGKWMLILYHIDNYRSSGYTDHLLSAIKKMEEKHTEEGETSATIRLLTHMKLINNMESVCFEDPDSITCSQLNLEDEKRYLFSTAHGFLSMLLKEPPLNNVD